MTSQSIKAYVMGEGLQKVLAISALVILYLFFSRFGTHFATMDTFVSILDSSYYLGLPRQSSADRQMFLPLRFAH